MSGPSRADKIPSSPEKARWMATDRGVRGDPPLPAASPPPCPLAAMDTTANCAVACAMKTSIDSAGRLVLPKAIRDEPNLQPGDPPEVTSRDRRLAPEPA